MGEAGGGQTRTASMVLAGPVRNDLVRRPIAVKTLERSGCRALSKQVNIGMENGGSVSLLRLSLPGCVVDAIDPRSVRTIFGTTISHRVLESDPISDLSSAGTAMPVKANLACFVSRPN